MKQWDVAREYRRRLKPALDQAGISIPFPQRSIWFKNSIPDGLKLSQADATQQIEPLNDGERDDEDEMMAMN